LASLQLGHSVVAEIRELIANAVQTKTTEGVN